MREEILKVRDVVWAKLTGFPWWPGVILSIQEGTKYEVLYFGDFNRSFLHCYSVRRFDPEEVPNLMGKRLKGSFQQALDYLQGGLDISGFISDDPQNQVSIENIPERSSHQNPT